MSPYGIQPAVFGSPCLRYHAILNCVTPNPLSMVMSTLAIPFFYCMEAALSMLVEMLIITDAVPVQVPDAMAAGLTSAPP